VVFAGNAGFRYCSNRLIPAYWAALDIFVLEMDCPSEYFTPIILVFVNGASCGPYRTDGCA
jgi:hypothetical protein